mmetsp:Transcript_19780/g.49852  ORF Transcript_19780/g.49852 Transcript_19780/m.49852 type:complete len:232 (+) Transcript_19780:731-1426(+)
MPERWSSSPCVRRSAASAGLRRTWTAGAERVQFPGGRLQSPRRWAASRRPPGNTPVRVFCGAVTSWGKRNRDYWATRRTTRLSRMKQEYASGPRVLLRSRRVVARPPVDVSGCRRRDLKKIHQRPRPLLKLDVFRQQLVVEHEDAESEERTQDLLPVHIPPRSRHALVAEDPLSPHVDCIRFVSPVVLVDVEDMGAEGHKLHEFRPGRVLSEDAAVQDGSSLIVVLGESIS